MANVCFAYFITQCGFLGLFLLDSVHVLLILRIDESKTVLNCCFLERKKSGTIKTSQINTVIYFPGNAGCGCLVLYCRSSLAIS